MTTAVEPKGRSSALSSKWPGLSLIGLAVVVILVSLGVIMTSTGSAFVDSVASTTYLSPTQQSMHLDHGRWEIYQREEFQSGSGGNSIGSTGGVTLTPDQVRVVGPDGAQVPVFASGNNVTIDRNGEDYAAAVGFTAATSGQYQISVGGSPGEILFSRNLGSLFRSVLGWVVSAGVGVLVFFVGILLLIVSASRRRRRLPYPPGWYPHPVYPGQSLWWSGSRWLDLPPPR